MEFVRIPTERFNDVILHLRETFFSDEPVNKSVCLCKPGEPHIELEKHSLSTLEDGLSIMAVTNDNKIAGVVLNGIIHPGDLEEATEKLGENEDEQFKKIFNLLYSESLKLDLFNRFDVDKIFEMRILSVDDEFRGQGLAQKLIKYSERLAFENGFKLLKADATGLYSQKCVLRLGFHALSEKRYDSCFNEDGTLTFAVEPPHQSLKILIKQLNIDSNNHCA